MLPVILANPFQACPATVLSRAGSLLSAAGCWLLLSCMSSPALLAQVGREEQAYDLPDPLTLEDTIAAARTHRREIEAARAVVQAYRERETTASALEDPMLIPAITHYPYTAMSTMDRDVAGGRFDWSFTVQQRFPLSRVRSHLRRGAEAETRRLTADADQVVLDMELAATEAFFMLKERRRMADIAAGQISLAEQMLVASNARYAAARGAQVDILRAEVEVSRLTGVLRALSAEIVGLEAMFNASIGRVVDAEVPALEARVPDGPPPAYVQLLQDAFQSRPELQAGTAKVASAVAEVDVMKSMYRPMLMVQAGPASSMVAGEGGMLMVGISLPIWRSKLRAGVAEAQAMEQMARADLAAMRRMIEAEALEARANVLAAREAHASLRDEVVPLARRMIEPMLASYAEGSSPLASVIDAAQAQWAAEAELIMAETRLDIAWARLARATGGLSEVSRE